MRRLRPAPTAAVDPAVRAPVLGSYRGSVELVDYTPLEPKPVRRFFREKRWLFGALMTREVHVAFAVVDLGYASTAFAHALRVRGQHVVAKASFEGLPGMGRVRREPGRGLHASFSHPRAVFRIEQRGHILRVDFEVPSLVVHAVVDLDASPPPLTAIAPLEGDAVTLTEKRALLPVEGSVLAAGERFELREGFAGLDYSHGLLPRDTRWRWAFAQGWLEGGAPFAVNLVDGFVGERECALFLKDDVSPLGEGHVTLPERGSDVWEVSSVDGVNLHFLPAGGLLLAKNLGAVRSRFEQYVGCFRGEVPLPTGERARIADAFGVVESQEVRW